MGCDPLAWVRAAAAFGPAVFSSVVAGPAAGAVIPGNAISVSVPAGSVDTNGSPYTDDVFLNALGIGSATFSANSSFRAVQQLTVISGRSEINAEWGDDDSASDGDDTPFVKSGNPGASQETEVPAIQDAALLNAFNSLSLTEMSDGEGGGSFTFRALFSASLTDNASGPDSVPEIVFFERGLNDSFDVRLIVGGSFANPVFAPTTVRVSSGDFWDTGIDVNTVEIDSAQPVGAGGLDLDDFGVTAMQAAFGFELSNANGTGPDLNGFFLAAEDPTRFGDPLEPVPLPASVAGLLAALGLLRLVSRRREAAACGPRACKNSYNTL